jgi:hypothetical protein
MLKKSKKFKAMIKVALIKLLTEKAEKVHVPGFRKISVQLKDAPEVFIVEKIFFSEMEINPQDFNCSQEHFFFLIDYPAPEKKKEIIAA